MTWDDDKRTFRSRPDIPTDERLTADEWNAHVSDQKDHADRHEAGGVDELVVDGLAGVLADPQPPQEEAVEDFVAGLLSGGDKVTTIYDDGAGSLTVNTSALDAEEVDDRVDGLLSAGDKLSLTYDDANDTLTIDTSALDTEEVEDAVNALVAGGDGITTSYDDANDTLTLSIPDNSVTAAMLAEAYFTESEADDRFYNISGDTLEGDVDANTNTITDAGHDEVDVPQTFDLTVDDFERPSLGSDYVGDLADAQIQSSVALEGSRSLEINRSSTGEAVVGKQPTDAVQFGDSFKVHIQLTDGRDDVSVGLIVSDPATPFGGDSVLCQVNPKSDFIRVRQVVSGNLNDFTGKPAPVSNHLNERLTIQGAITEDGVISFSLIDSAGSKLAQVSNSLSQNLPVSGGVAFQLLNDSTPPTVYFDGPFISRRLGEETRDRQRGSTETSKLQTRGGVGAGPRILPENRAAEIMADAGITSALAAGTEVSYGLQLNGRKMLTIFGEADGSGGLQNPAVDFEDRQLKDVSNNQTADSMTANPEADTEDGFIEVELGGTAYQIPVYQA